MTDKTVVVHHFNYAVMWNIVMVGSLITFASYLFYKNSVNLFKDKSMANCVAWAWMFTVTIATFITAIAVAANQ